MQRETKRIGAFVKILTSAIVLITIALDTAAIAQEEVVGGQIAKTWCSGCHVITRDDRAVANDAIPSFAAIARSNTTTAAGLAAFLSTPHVNMPNYSLTGDDIRELSAYILSLRK